MPESYIKAEIVRPKWDREEWATKIISGIIHLGLVTLVAFWFFASWFPQFGLTYWQLVLPVFAVRNLIAPPMLGRQLK